MATINLYKLSSDMRSLTKTLDNPISKSIDIRTDIDIYNPIMLLQDFDIAYDYMSWDNRYYFVNNAYYTANKVWRLQCNIDVLMTYRDIILASKATVLRIGNNNYLQGANIQMTSKPSYLQYAFPNNPFSHNTDNYILTAIGGESVISG